ncbi:hypothetical protein Cantr_08378 [Candida viswanathii]|uniref:Uncharacterized protein n=1 Tax=Candida viswanathii TaxID=5486 RepID=A0A367Y537_9ASCO|nr:hypothetical protein Cantr_08378 [Candida viswanathii]
MVVYKNCHCIPDSLIRDELEAASSRLSDEDVDLVVATAVADARSDESEPIKYSGLPSYLEVGKPKLNYSDFTP